MATYAAKLCPYSSVIFRERNSGKLAAISLCHPNYYDLHLPKSDAPNFSARLFKIIPQNLLAKTVGVHPDFRQQGLMDLLAAYAMRNFQTYYEK